MSRIHRLIAVPAFLALLLSAVPAVAQGNAQRTVIGAVDPDGKIQPASAPLNCPLSVAVNITSATTTQIVALAAGQRVYVCSVALYAIGAATPVTAAFVYGTGAACGTGTTGLTGPMSSSTTAGSVTPIVFSDGMGYTFRTPVATALCITSTGVTGLAGVVSYAQF